MPFDRLRALSLSKRLARQSAALCEEPPKSSALSRIARPERRVAELLVRLGPDLPTRSRIVEDLPIAAPENVVQKTDV